MLVPVAILNKTTRRFVDWAESRPIHLVVLLKMVPLALPILYLNHSILRIFLTNGITQLGSYEVKWCLWAVESVIISEPPPLVYPHLTYSIANGLDG